jgi:hypothetical protein
MSKPSRLTSRVALASLSLSALGAPLVLAACSSSGDGGGVPLPTTTQASIGPIDLQPGEEKTVCIRAKIGTGQALLATRLSADLAPGSHHMIVYKTTATDEDLTPTPCAPFVNTFINGSDEAPIALIGKEQAVLDFPAGVGVVIEADQVVKIEAHYINAGKTALKGAGTFKVEGLPLAQATGYQSADVLFWGTRQIDIPAKQSWSTGKHFQAGLPGTKMFYVTTHQHSHGSEAQVWASPARGQTGARLADDTNWAEPRYVSVDPQLAFDGTSGLTYQCDYLNDTTSGITFGESALDEMCFVIGYYYPGKGSDLCFDGYCPLRQK